MAFSKEEALAALIKLSKGNEAVGKIIHDYVTMPWGTVSTTTLYEAVLKVHDHAWTKDFTDCLEEIKNPMKRTNNN